MDILSIKNYNIEHTLLDVLLVHARSLHYSIDWPTKEKRHSKLLEKSSVLGHLIYIASHCIYIYM